MRYVKGLVSVIIPTFNRKEMLVKCVDSVLRSKYKKIEIIVSDDASSDGTERIIKRYTKLKNFIYLRNKKESLLSVTINNAILASNGEYIFILDDDNVIDKNCVKELVSTFVKFKNVGIVGPIAFYKSRPNMIMHAGTMRSKYARRAIPFHWKEKSTGQLKEGLEVEDFANAFVFKREVLQKAGMWDLLIPFQGEDGDFETRVRLFGGYKIILNPKAKVYHDRVYEEKGQWEDRINEMRMYHFMHSKILYVYRYDTAMQKITFTLFLPVYFVYYVKLILFNLAPNQHRTKVFSSLIRGIIFGISDALLNKQQIVKYPKDLKLK